MLVICEIYCAMFIKWYVFVKINLFYVNKVKTLSPRYGAIKKESDIPNL